MVQKRLWEEVASGVYEFDDRAGLDRDVGDQPLDRLSVVEVRGEDLRFTPGQLDLVTGSLELPRIARHKHDGQAFGRKELGSRQSHPARAAYDIGQPDNIIRSHDFNSIRLSNVR